MYKFGASYIYKANDKSKWTVDKFYSVAKDKEAFLSQFYKYILNTKNAKKFVKDSHKYKTVLNPKLEEDKYLIDVLNLKRREPDNHYLILDNDVKIIILYISDGILISSNEIAHSAENIFALTVCRLNVPAERFNTVFCDLLPFCNRR